MRSHGAPVHPKRAATVVAAIECITLIACQSRVPAPEPDVSIAADGSEAPDTGILTDTDASVPEIADADVLSNDASSLADTPDTPDAPDTQAPADGDGLQPADGLDVAAPPDSPPCVPLTADLDATPPTGEPCDDGNPCTSADLLHDGKCFGTPFSCLDDDPCTRDTCDPATGCFHETIADCCGASIGAPCPTDLGFECVKEAGRAFCLNKKAGEVFVPGGMFWIGCGIEKEGERCFRNFCYLHKDGTTECWKEPELSTPQTLVHESSFAIDRSEVTVAQYQACVEAGGCSWPPYVAPGPPDHPMTEVNIWNVWEYCAWEGGTTGSRSACRESQWEMAARGGCATLGCAPDDLECCRRSVRSFPWGDQAPDCSRAVMDEGTGPGCAAGSTLPVGGRPLGMSIYGALDLAGNVEEWTWDDLCVYGSWEQQTCVAGGIDAPSCSVGSFGATAVFRGGSYLSKLATIDLNEETTELASSDRRNCALTAADFCYAGVWRTPSLGFRCCRQLDLAPALPPPPTSPCDDGDACTEGDAKYDGACTGIPISCADGDACTIDTCDPAIGCLHAPTDDCCVASIGSACPTDLGFECTQDGGRYFCLNSKTDEVFVPAGVFWMGCNEAKYGKHCRDWERPTTLVSLSGFAIDRREMTNGKYSALGAGSGGSGLECDDAVLVDPSMTPFDPELPVNYVSTSDENCKDGDPALWASGLCTGAQWEMAARGSCATVGCAPGDTDCCRVHMRTYPWGDELPDCTRTIMQDASGPGCGAGFLSPPGSRPLDMSVYGALDMAGNIREWIKSWWSCLAGPTFTPLWDDPQYKEGVLFNPDCAGPTGGVRGGAWTTPVVGSDAQWLRPSLAGMDDGYCIYPTIGLRCCRTFVTDPTAGAP